MRVFRSLAAALGLVLTATSLGGAPADAAPRQITANVFQSGALWPFWIGIRNGFFQDRGIDLKLVYTQNSRAQMTGLIEGKFEVAVTALDNVIAYMEGQGGVNFDKRPDLVAVAGAGDGFLSLVTAPDIASFDQVRGRTLAVDALSTGFSFVLQDMLARAHLKPDDYSLESVGGTAQRWQALEAGKAAGALLTPPLTLIAENKGFRILSHASEMLGGYQGLVVTVNRPWARENADTVVDFIRAYRASLDWLFDPKNREAAIAILRAEIPETSPQLAQATYGFFVNPKRGFNRDGGIDMAGARNVMEMRSRYMRIVPPLTNLDAYVDMTYFNRAQ